MSTNEQSVVEAGGFDIDGQKELARREDQGTPVHIRGLDDKPMFFKSDSGENLPVEIVIAGAHSSLFQREEAAIRRRKFSARNLTGQAFHDDNIQKAAACTLSWQGFFSRGNPVRCDRHNAEKLYEACPWVMDQVVEAMNDHKRFISSSSTEQ